MSSTCFESEGSSSGRKLYVQLWHLCTWQRYNQSCSAVLFSTLEGRLIITLACKQIIPYLYVQPSSLRWTIGFEICGRNLINYNISLTNFHFVSSYYTSIFCIWISFWNVHSKMSVCYTLIYKMSHEKVARLPFCTCPSYCTDFCIYTMLRTQATFSRPNLRVGYEKVGKTRHSVYWIYIYEINIGYSHFVTYLIA
jgi:hypothetical protein